MQIEDIQSFLNEFQTGRKAAKAVGISHNWLYILVREGKVSKFKIGNLFVFHIPTLKKEINEK